MSTDSVADGELESVSEALAEELRGFPLLAQRSTKKLMNDIEDAGLSLAIELEGSASSTGYSEVISQTAIPGLVSRGSLAQQPAEGCTTPAIPLRWNFAACF